MRSFTFSSTTCLVSTIFLFCLKFEITKSQCWKGKIQKGKRCADAFKTVTKVSRKQCLASCLKTSGCCSVNYNRDQNLCEMCPVRLTPTLDDDLSFSYIGEVDIAKNCGISVISFQSLCVPCLGSFPNLNKAVTTLDLSQGYPVIQYTCSDGYMPDGGTKSSTCNTQQKQWTIPTMTCKELGEYGDPPTINSTEVTKVYLEEENVLLAKYQCRDYRQRNSIPYCPVSRYIGPDNWTTPSISCATNDCIHNGNVSAYTGKRFCTKSGRICQSWIYNSPHHNYYQGYTDSSDANYCRPAGLNYKPWCYTMDPEMRWEYCVIPNC